MSESAGQPHSARVRACLERAVTDPSVLEGVDPDTHLFENAVLDSVATVTMIEALEAEFQITLTDADVFSPEFTTLRGLESLVNDRVDA